MLLQEKDHTCLYADISKLSDNDSRFCIVHRANCVTLQQVSFPRMSCLYALYLCTSLRHCLIQLTQLTNYLCLGQDSVASGFVSKYAFPSCADCSAQSQSPWFLLKSSREVLFTDEFEFPKLEGGAVCRQGILAVGKGSVYKLGDQHIVLNVLCAVMFNFLLLFIP